MIVSLRLSGVKVLVIGSSQEALDRAHSLIHEGAKVVLYSPNLRPNPEGGVRLVKKERPSIRELFTARVVIATDRNPRVNSWLFRWRSVCGFFLNTLDEKETCDFYHMSTRTPQPGITLAVSTSGASPSFAKSLANRLAASITYTDFEVLQGLAEIRSTLIADGRSTFGYNWHDAEQALRCRITGLNTSQKAS